MRILNSKMRVLTSFRLISVHRHLSAHILGRSL